MQRDRESSWRDSVTSVSETNRNPPSPRFWFEDTKYEVTKDTRRPEKKPENVVLLHQHGLTSSSAPFL